MILRSIRTIVLTLPLALGVQQARAQEEPRARDYGSTVLAKCDGMDDKTQADEKLRLLRSVPAADSLFEKVLLRRLGLELDNEKFTEALTTCELGIREKGELEHIFHLEKIVSLSGLKRHDEAMAYADQCIKRYPGNFQFYNMRGLVLVEKGERAKALEQYKANVIRFPFRPEAHTALADCARLEGKIAQAALCLSMAQVVSYGGGRDERNLATLDQVLTGNEDPDPKGYDLGQGDDFTDIDLLLKNRVAMDKKYKVEPNLPYPMCRQSHLLFTTISKNTPGDGFWATHYVPFFKRLMSEGLFEGFVYNSINNSTNAEVNGPARKKAAVVKTFRDRSAEILMEMFQTYPDSAGAAPQKHWYNENGDMLAVGEGDTKAKVFSGPWTYYRNNGAVSAKGLLGSDGKRTGEWREFFSNGLPRKVVNYNADQEDGLLLTYYVTGALNDSVMMKDGKAVGLYHHHLMNGTLKYEKTVVDGDFTGPVITRFACGALEDSYTVKKDSPDGAATSYHPNGRTQYTGNYVLGKRTGVQTTYYANGVKESEYTYVEGKTNGPCKEWWPNGQLKREGTQTNGDWTGPFRTWDAEGLLSSEGQSDEKGRLTGVQKDYSSGWLHLEQEYAHDLLTRYRYTDRTGKVQSEGERKKGKFQMVGYSEEGFKASEGTYLDEGAKDGSWKYFYADGTVSSEENYTKGDLQGVQHDYTRSGKLLREYSYEGKSRNGAYKQYYLDGKPEYIGWLQNGKLNGTYRHYFPDGTLVADEYYVDGDRDGWQTYYDPEGKVENVQRIVDGEVLEKYRYDATGKEIQYYLVPAGPFTLREVSPSGKPLNEIQMVNGRFHGKAKWFYPNGKVLAEGQYVNGDREGLWKGYYADGKERYEQHYENGEHTGMDKEWYRNGTLRSEESYAFDEQSGPYRYYERNGKLAVERTYLHGAEHGIGKSYAFDGGLQIVRFFDHGRLTGYALPTADGKYGDTITVTTGVIDLKPLYPDGKTARVFRYRNGELDGPYTSYHPNGKLMEEAIYEDGKDMGPDKEYYSTGTLREVNNYVDGLRHGEYALYGENGKPLEQGTFRYGQMHGEFKVWDATGKLLSTAVYRDDDMIDLH